MGTPNAHTSPVSGTTWGGAGGRTSSPLALPTSSDTGKSRPRATTRTDAALGRVTRGRAGGGYLGRSRYSQSVSARLGVPRGLAARPQEVTASQRRAPSSDTCGSPGI